MNDKTNNTTVVIGHTSEEIVLDIKYVMNERHSIPVLVANRPSAFRILGVRYGIQPTNQVTIYVIDQSIEPREAESVWTDAETNENALVVVCAKSDQDKKRIAETSRRIVLGPDADSTSILEAIHTLRVRRGRNAQEAFEAGVIWLEPATGRVRVHNRDIKVPADQFKALEVLASDPFRTFPKDELTITLTGNRAISRREVRDTERLCHRLRRTLKDAHLDAVLEPAGIGFQLLPVAISKAKHTPVQMKVAA